MRQHRWKRWPIIVFWLLIWHFLALWVDNKILLSTPLQALQALFTLLPKAAFWQSVAGSLLRIGSGFLAGVLTAFCLAALCRRIPFLEELLAPAMSLFKAVPVASFVVIFLIWWGSSFLAVAVSFLVVLPNMYINTLEGLKSTDRKLLEMAKVFHIPFKNRFFYIYRPALKPFVSAGLQLSVGMGIKSGVAAEVIGTPAFSIGERLYMSKIYLETADVFAWTAVVILLSCFLERSVLQLTKWFFLWEPKCAGNKKNADGQTVREIRCRHLHKTYGEETVIQDWNAEYRTGEIYYLTTPSGSGKTTFFRMLCGLEQPDGGEITGVERCAVMFQEDRLCEDYSAVRNVEMAVGQSSRVREALLQLLPKESLDKPCGQLSGGMKRRVALVRAMEAEAQCVLLDEPFTGMDADTKACVEQYIYEQKKNRILLIATHL